MYIRHCLLMESLYDTIKNCQRRVRSTKHLLKGLIPQNISRFKKGAKLLLGTQVKKGRKVNRNRGSQPLFDLKTRRVSLERPLLACGQSGREFSEHSPCLNLYQSVCYIHFHKELIVI